MFNDLMQPIHKTLLYYKNNTTPRVKHCGGSHMLWIYCSSSGANIFVHVNSYDYKYHSGLIQNLQVSARKEEVFISLRLYNDLN